MKYFATFKKGKNPELTYADGRTFWVDDTPPVLLKERPRKKAVVPEETQAER